MRPFDVHVTGDAAFDQFVAAISEALDGVVAGVVGLVSSVSAAAASPDRQ